MKHVFFLNWDSRHCRKELTAGQSFMAAGRVFYNLKYFKWRGIDILLREILKLHWYIALLNFANNHKGNEAPLISSYQINFKPSAT